MRIIFQAHLFTQYPTGTPAPFCQVARVFLPAILLLLLCTSPLPFFTDRCAPPGPTFAFASFRSQSNCFTSKANAPIVQKSGHMNETRQKENVIRYSFTFLLKYSLFVDFFILQFQRIIHFQISKFLNIFEYFRRLHRLATHLYTMTAHKNKIKNRISKR